MSAVHTEFLSASNAAQLVARTGVVECLRLMADAIEADFARWQDFDKSARVGAHSEHGVIELMPVADATDYAFKYVNGHPSNARHGLPTVMIGNGSQSEFQALAFVGLLGVRELRLFDVDTAASAKLLRNIGPALGEYGASAQICDSAEDAVRGADIVTTLTASKARATIVGAQMLAPGMHLNAVGGDCPGKTELAAAVLTNASVFVEYEPQTRVEGDLQQMPADFAVTEFWRVIQGLAPGRRADDEITVFDSVGFALEDYSALRTMRELGKQAGLLESIELIPALKDPKDLFGSLRLSARPVHLRRA